MLAPRSCFFFLFFCFFFLKAEDGIRDLVRSRGLGDVYKRQALKFVIAIAITPLIYLGRYLMRRCFGLVPA